MNDRLVIEEEKKLLKESITKKETLVKLLDNVWFKEIILTDYLETKSIGLVHELGLLTSLEDRALNRNAMLGISCLNKYLSDVITAGLSAQISLKEYEDTFDE